jgi:hypothetical protein
MAESQSTVRLVDASGQDRINGTLYVSQPTAGAALSTHQLTTGTSFQFSTTANVHTVTLITGDATNNAATVVVALSQDDNTYSTLCTTSIAAAINTQGAIAYPLSVFVPAGWYMKLTLSHATVSTTTYY